MALFVCVALVLPACVDGSGECGPVPGIAAGPHEVLALSCAAAVEFRGVEYTVGCGEVHRSRMGALLDDDGGKTEYRGVRAIIGVPPSHMVVLIGPGCGKQSQNVGNSAEATRGDERLAGAPLSPLEDASGG